MSDTLNLCRDCGANLTGEEPHRETCRHRYDALPEEKPVPQTLDELLASGDPDESYEAWWL